MKHLHLPFLLMMVTTLTIISCRSTKQVSSDQTIQSSLDMSEQELLQKVQGNKHTAQYVASKIKFKVEMGAQEISLSGKLLMRRDDVIRLQLMAFGFVEAARIEFTKDYVLVMDRINKQYLKVPYQHIDFLRTSGINFYMLQALFWNELFEPGKTDVSKNMLKKLEIDLSGIDAVMKFNQDKLSYSWLTEKNTGEILMTNILYADRFRGNSQLNWDYNDFKTYDRYHYPSTHNITLTLPKKEVKVGININSISHDASWEPRTTISNKYKEVMLDDILHRLMSL